MEGRLCPGCQTMWYSAVAQEDWICEKCGAKIPKPTSPK